MNFEIFIDRNNMRRQLDVYIYAKNGEGKVFKASPREIVFSEIEDPALTVDPAFSLNYLDADNFLSALYKALVTSGFDDKFGETTKEIKRIENHLEDMRKISFKFLDKES